MFAKEMFDWLSSYKTSELKTEAGMINLQIIPAKGRSSVVWLSWLHFFTVTLDP
jgi:hypothetical protein